MALVGNLTLNRLLVRVGTVPAELFRTAFNLALCTACGHFTDWTPAVWLWLPFQALVMSMVERLSRMMLVTFAILFCTAGILEGAPPLYALLACLTALGIVALTEPHLNEVRVMLTEAEARKHELEQAQAETARAHEELRQQVAEGERMELELRQAQKLESVGRLASGMAHEINTPVQFISDSVRFLSHATTDLTALIARYKSSVTEAGSTEAVRAGAAQGSRR